MFGLLVALALAIAAVVTARDLRGAESVGRLRTNAHTIVGDLAIITFIMGIVDAIVFNMFFVSVGGCSEPWMGFALAHYLYIIVIYSNG
jgi:hypothetical protein